MTRPGNLLKKLVPFLTIANWREVTPSFVKADLAACDGGSACGDFRCTPCHDRPCDRFDRSPPRSPQGAAERSPGYPASQGTASFPLLGLHSDNRSDFINAQLVRYCDLERSSFTRSRTYRKSDGCCIEQQNNYVDHCSVGSARFASSQALEVRNFLLPIRAPQALVNFIYPNAEIVSKSRSGSQVIHIHDCPMTHFKGVLDHASMAGAATALLVALHPSSNPSRPSGISAPSIVPRCLSPLP
jgi:hypothetical protein